VSRLLGAKVTFVAQNDFGSHAAQVFSTYIVLLQLFLRLCYLSRVFRLRSAKTRATRTRCMYAWRSLEGFAGLEKSALSLRLPKLGVVLCGCPTDSSLHA